MPRPRKIEWPDDARICVTFIVPYEVWPAHLGTAQSRQSQQGHHIPPPNARFKTSLSVITEREYGDRAGIWRLLDLFKRYDLKVTLLLNGLKAVGAKKVAIIHPFDTESETNAPGNMHYDCLSRHGFELTAIKGADRPAIELGRIPSEAPLAIARELKEAHPEVDTISFPCPHWAVAELIDPLETELGVNVVTALQTIVWESLRLCGIKDSIGGYGRLLREH